MICLSGMCLKDGSPKFADVKGWMVVRRFGWREGLRTGRARKVFKAT